MRGVDIAIRGAGPVDCVLALALRDSGLSIVLCEKKIESDGKTISRRPIALSYASRLILERVGAWEALSTTPIRRVHVSQAGQFGRTRLDAADAGVPALGYVVEYAALTEALRRSVRDRGIDLREQAVSAARCVVHAEGSPGEDAREKDYRRDALVALVETDRPAHGTAFERFTPEGPLALLPLEGAYGLVWALTPERAADLVAANDGKFLAALGAAFGARAGRFLRVSGRERTALALRVRRSRVADREVYIGNAAQALHPVAGQGLNLGLRDAWDLSQSLRGAADPGAAPVLARFAARRRFDAQATIRVTDLLAGAFLGTSRWLGAARGLAMAALDAAPPARRFFARRMIFGPAAIP